MSDFAWQLLNLSQGKLQPSTIGPRLKNLIVRHQGVALSAHFYALFDWIKTIIIDIPSPLRVLRLIADDDRLCGTIAPLLKILTAQNLNTLDTLRMPHMMLRREDLLSIFRLQRLKDLEFYLWDPESIVKFMLRF